VELRQNQQISLGRAQLGREIPGWFAMKIPMRCQKMLDLADILLPLDGARRVHQQASRFHYGSCAVEELGLEIHDVPQRLRRYPPPGIGVTGDGAGTRARRVEQNEV
jgi:hypothetical protein